MNEFGKKFTYSFNQKLHCYQNSNETTKFEKFTITISEEKLSLKNPSFLQEFKVNPTAASAIKAPLKNNCFFIIKYF